MGGVDRFDQMIQYYNMKRKTNRWTQRFSIHIFDILLHNSYIFDILYHNEKTISHYDYVENIITYLLSKVGVNSPKERTSSTLSYHLPI